MLRLLIIVELIRMFLIRIFNRKFLKAEKGVLFTHWPQIKCPVDIGDNTRINGRIVIKGRAAVTIGKYCAIGDGIRIISANHLMFRPSIQMLLYSRLFDSDLLDDQGPVVIGNDVWLGDAVIILPGVTIGDGSIIGAGSVVDRDIPPYVVAAGVPARKIRDRFPESVRDQLMKIKWWKWTERKMRINRIFFMQDLSRLNGADIGSLIREEDNT